MSTESYSGIVDKIIRDGKHGPYAVISTNIGLVTMALQPSVWCESKWPELGTVVILSQVIKKRAGWRAQQGRYFKPSDES